MGLRAVRSEPIPVALPYGDAYLLRLATEHRRIQHLIAASVDQLESHERHLVNALAARNLTTLDIAGVSITRHGRTGILIGATSA